MLGIDDAHDVINYLDTRKEGMNKLSNEYKYCLKLLGRTA